jgi:hexosaminidase
VPTTTGNDVTIEAASVFGSLLALESLQQLLSFTTPGRIINAPVTIVDTPEYSVRGLMVNPSIRFMPVPFLKRVVDGLAINKMNYLHIHFTDVRCALFDRNLHLRMPLSFTDLLLRLKRCYA